MKILIGLIVASFSLSTFGESFLEKAFPSLEECRLYSISIIDEYKNKPSMEFFDAVGIQSDENTALELLLMNMDKIKNGETSFKYMEEIGSVSLGSFVTRFAYITKYEQGTVFYEVTIGKKSNDDFRIVGFDFKANTDGQKLLDDIPSYYWK